MSNPDPWTHVEGDACRCVGCQMMDKFWTGFLEGMQRALDEECFRILMDAGMWGAVGWYCEECGRPQIGDLVWPGRKRCRACGPGEGWVPCPASGGNHGDRCVLCKGVGYVEELL